MSAAVNFPVSSDIGTIPPIASFPHITSVSHEDQPSPIVANTPLIFTADVAQASQNFSSTSQTSAFTFVTQSTLENNPPSTQDSFSFNPPPETIAPTSRDSSTSAIVSQNTIRPIESSISLLPTYVPSSDPNIPVSSTSTAYTSTTPTPTSSGAVPTQPVHSGLSTSTLIPLVVVLGVAAAGVALLITLRMLRRRRRRNAHQDGRIQHDDAQDEHDRFVRHSAMEECGTSRLPSVRVLSAEAQDSSITPYTHDDSAHTQSQSVTPSWTPSSHSKTLQTEMIPARASFGPPSFDDGELEPLPPPAPFPREEASVTRVMSTEVSDTVLLRLPVDLARGLIALVAGANVRGGVRYAGESEDGQGSEYLPAYESEPSASEVVASVMPG